MIMALWLPLTMVTTLYVSGVVAQMTYEVGRVLTDEFDNSDGSKWAYVAADMYMRALMHDCVHAHSSSQYKAGYYLFKFSCILLPGSIYKQTFFDKMCVRGLLRATCIPVRVYVISTCTGFGLPVFTGLYT